MEKGKVVVLEDRIPKLKQQRRRKANRRLIFLLFLFFSLIAIVVYVQSPLSHVKRFIVTGNEVYSSDAIIEKSGLSTKMNIWQIKGKQIASKVMQLPEMKRASVKVRFPNTVTIQVREYKKVSYLKKDSVFYPILENGRIITEGQKNILPINAPILIGFEEGNVLNEMVLELKKLPTEVLNSISEIHYQPYKTDQYHIELYMNDGFEVSATIRSFSDKMSHYPDIINQLNPNQKGVIDLEVGSYFKEFGQAGKNQNAKNEGKK